MSRAESNFLAWMRRERRATQIAHVREIVANGGSCGDYPHCGRCPLPCSVLESDDIVLMVAREWLKDNADA